MFKIERQHRGSYRFDVDAIIRLVKEFEIFSGRPPKIRIEFKDDLAIETSDPNDINDSLVDTNIICRISISTNNKEDIAHIFLGNSEDRPIYYLIEAERAKSESFQRKIDALLIKSRAWHSPAFRLRQTTASLRIVMNIFVIIFMTMVLLAFYPSQFQVSASFFIWAFPYIAAITVASALIDMASKSSVFMIGIKKNKISNRNKIIYYIFTVFIAAFIVNKISEYIRIF